MISSLSKFKIFQYNFIKIRLNIFEIFTRKLFKKFVLGKRIGHEYLCHFWWAINPIAKQWFNLIEANNPQTYAWAYDEFFVPN